MADQGPRLADLRTISLFRGFSDDELAEIAGLFTRALPRDGGVVFEVDETAACLYLLAAGEVVLERPGDDTYRLRPPALIGELGALTGLLRSTRAIAQSDAELWALEAATLQRFLGDNQELGVRFLVNLLEVVADKVDRDQRRMADMRTNLVRTQKALKQLRELVLDTVDTPLSAPVHDTLDQLITHNRRVNYRIEPPAALAARFRLDTGDAKVVMVSRTHLAMLWPEGVTPPEVGTWIAGVLDLAGAELPASGKIVHRGDRRVAIELDLLIDESSAALEGYLTRVQLLDILV
jgi:CRP/FNR family transcriptional regulator, cyclic AMP receptor protein